MPRNIVLPLLCALIVAGCRAEPPTAALGDGTSTAQPSTSEAATTIEFVFGSGPFDLIDPAAGLDALPGCTGDVLGQPLA